MLVQKHQEKPPEMLPYECLQISGDFPKKNPHLGRGDCSTNPQKVPSWRLRSNPV